MDPIAPFVKRPVSVRPEVMRSPSLAAAISPSGFVAATGPRREELAERWEGAPSKVESTGMDAGCGWALNASNVPTEFKNAPVDRGGMQPYEHKGLERMRSAGVTSVLPGTYYDLETQVRREGPGTHVHKVASAHTGDAHRALRAAPAAARSGWNGNAGSTNGGTIAPSRSAIPSPRPLRPGLGRRAIGRVICYSLGEGGR